MLADLKHGFMYICTHFLDMLPSSPTLSDQTRKQATPLAAGMSPRGATASWPLYSQLPSERIFLFPKYTPRSTVPHAAHIQAKQHNMESFPYWRAGSQGGLWDSCPAYAVSGRVRQSEGKRYSFK